MAHTQAAAGGEHQRIHRADLDYYEDRARGLLASATDATPTAVAAFARWDAPLNEDGARTVLAREHGLPAWDGLARAVSTPDPAMAGAHAAVETHDLRGLRGALDADPGLVAARAANDNDLLAFATSAGDPGLVDALLERGADPARANVHGWTPLHQAAYAGRADLARMLISAGAPVGPHGRGDGGTPLVVALFWGHRIPAALVDVTGLAPGNLRVAAGLGRVDLIEELVAGDGTPSPAAGAHRGFYRPHSGFPAWRASTDPREVVDEALAWAARSDRPEAVAALAGRGARLDADINRGTALAWAAAQGHEATIARLLQLGADPDGSSSFGGPDHGEGATPLHLAARGDRTGAISALLAAGADPAARDARHGGTPADWAAFGGHRAAEALLRGRR